MKKASVDKSRTPTKGAPHHIRFVGPVDNFLRNHCQEVAKMNKTDYLNFLVTQDMERRGLGC